MNTKTKRILIDVVISLVFAVISALITIFIHNIGVLIAIPMIEASIYALWHAKNIVFEKPEEPEPYRRPKVPTAGNSVKQEHKNAVWNEKKSPLRFFRRKTEKGHGHQSPRKTLEMS